MVKRIVIFLIICSYKHFQHENITVYILGVESNRAAKDISTVNLKKNVDNRIATFSDKSITFRYF